ncbi:MAG: hypothetical protein IPK16_26240 [Anaerolineales bacterium]|nr:hypothetical protein [Anaerolineales bacterium]
MVYAIRIAGTLGNEWAGWFEGMTITLADNGDTILTGQVSDQAALHGLLKKVRDLGIPLLALNCIEPAQAEAPNRENIPGEKQGE